MKNRAWIIGFVFLLVMKGGVAYSQEEKPGGSFCLEADMVPWGSCPCSRRAVPSNQFPQFFHPGESADGEQLDLGYLYPHGRIRAGFLPSRPRRRSGLVRRIQSPHPELFPDVRGYGSTGRLLLYPL
jgi:hypothetical protein